MKTLLRKARNKGADIYFLFEAGKNRIQFANTLLLILITVGVYDMSLFMAVVISIVLILSILMLGIVQDRTRVLHKIHEARINRQPQIMRILDNTDKILIKLENNEKIA